MGKPSAGSLPAIRPALGNSMGDGYAPGLFRRRTWSTSPDPVDFRNFTGPDLYRAGQNALR
jgi:hypothetical protein